MEQTPKQYEEQLRNNAIWTAADLCKAYLAANPAAVADPTAWVIKNAKRIYAFTKGETEA